MCSTDDADASSTLTSADISRSAHAANGSRIETRSIKVIVSEIRSGRGDDSRSCRRSFLDSLASELARIIPSARFIHSSGPALFGCRRCPANSAPPSHYFTPPKSIEKCRLAREGKKCRGCDSMGTDSHARPSSGHMCALQRLLGSNILVSQLSGGYAGQTRGSLVLSEDFCVGLERRRQL